MRQGWMRSVSAILVLALITACPAVAGELLDDYSPDMGVSGDTSSDGAVITVALFATCLVVLGIVALKSDVENVLAKSDDGKPVLRQEIPESKLSLVVENPQMKSYNRKAQNTPEPDMSSVGVGLRMRF